MLCCVLFSSHKLLHLQCYFRVNREISGKARMYVLTKIFPLEKHPLRSLETLKLQNLTFFFAVIVMKCPHFAKKAQPSPGISSVCSLDRFVA